MPAGGIHGRGNGAMGQLHCMFHCSCPRYWALLAAGGRLQFDPDPGPGRSPRLIKYLSSRRRFVSRRSIRHRAGNVFSADGRHKAKKPPWQERTDEAARHKEEMPPWQDQENAARHKMPPWQASQDQETAARHKMPFALQRHFSPTEAPTRRASTSRVPTCPGIRGASWPFRG